MLELMQINLTQQVTVIIYWLLGILAALILAFSIKNLLKVGSVIGFRGANMPRAVSFMILANITALIYVLYNLITVSPGTNELKIYAILDVFLLLLYVSTKEIARAFDKLAPEE